MKYMNYLILVKCQPPSSKPITRPSSYLVLGRGANERKTAGRQGEKGAAKA